MDLYIIQLIAGLILLIAGANYLTDGAVALAHGFGVSEFLVGLTIVAVGTSMPELTVSMLSAIDGKSDVSIGNIVGSDIFNVFLILGFTALVTPLFLTKENIRRDIPLYFLCSVLLFVLSFDSVYRNTDNMISRFDGVFMLLLYAAFLWYMMRSCKQKENVENERKTVKLWLAVIMVVGGLGALVWGADFFLDGSITLARKYGVSESAIAITLIAGGTSLPELATSFISALKGKNDIALGNVLGSNVANILLILGLSSVVRPLGLGGITMVDFGVMLLSAVLLFATAFLFRKKYLDRIEGVIFIVIYVGYVIWLLR